MPRFGDWLLRMMERRDINQAGLAARIGVAHTTVHGWIVGRMEPKPENIQRLSDALDVDVAEVYLALGRIAPPPTDEPEAMRRLLRLLDRVDPSQYAMLEAVIRALPRKPGAGAQPSERSEDQSGE